MDARRRADKFLEENGIDPAETRRNYNRVANDLQNGRLWMFAKDGSTYWVQKVCGLLAEHKCTNVKRFCGLQTRRLPTNRCPLAVAHAPQPPVASPSTRHPHPVLYV